ncbi:Uncharacterised protein [Elizabethkingia meningoseptica]|nr:Uncharacterised protein [Elizabethkingia meningoseptica]
MPRFGTLTGLIKFITYYVALSIVKELNINRLYYLIYKL